MIENLDFPTIPMDNLVNPLGPALLRKLDIPYRLGRECPRKQVARTLIISHTIPPFDQTFRIKL